MKGQSILLGYDALCASIFLIEVSKTLAQPKKACSLLCVHFWQKAKVFNWGHELWDQTRLWNLSAIKTEQNEVHVPATNDGEHLSVLFTFKISAKITHIPGMLTPGVFYPDRSFPKWKSLGVMVNCEFRWKWPHVMVTVSVFSLLMPWHCKNWQNSTNLLFSYSIWGSLVHCLGEHSSPNPLWRRDWPYVRHESQ